MKHKTSNLFLSIAIFLFLFLSVHTVLAQALEPVGPSDFGTLVSNIVTWIFNIAIPLAVLMVIWAGVIMLTSAGDQAKYSKGKQYLKYAIIGLTVVLIGRGFISLIQSVLQGSSGGISQPPGITLIVPTITPPVFIPPPSVLYTPTPSITPTPSATPTVSATPNKDIPLPTTVDEWIRYLYSCILSRPADAAGFTGWKNVFLQDRDAVAIYNPGFYQGDEFRDQRLPVMTDTELVTNLYNCALFYRPDAAEVRYWTDYMSRGLTRLEVINSFTTYDAFGTLSTRYYFVIQQLNALP